MQVHNLRHRLLGIKEEGALVAVSQLVVEISLDVVHFRVWYGNLFHLRDVGQSARKFKSKINYLILICIPFLHYRRHSPQVGSRSLVNLQLVGLDQFSEVTVGQGMRRLVVVVRGEEGHIVGVDGWKGNSSQLQWRQWTSVVFLGAQTGADTLRAVLRRTRPFLKGRRHWLKFRCTTTIITGVNPDIYSTMNCRHKGDHNDEELKLGQKHLWWFWLVGCLFSCTFLEWIDSLYWISGRTEQSFYNKALVVVVTTTGNNNNYTPACFDINLR